MAGELLLLVRLLASMLAVLALAVVVLRWVLPRLQGLRPGARRRVEVLEVRFLDRQHRVALLRVDGREHLVGFGGALTSLASWPETAAEGDR